MTRHPTWPGVSTAHRSKSGAETVFFCDQCGKKLSAPETAAGVVGKCPACHANVPVPFPIKRDTVKRKTVRISHGDQVEEPAAETPAVTEAGDSFIAEAGIGWAAGVLGVILIIISPRAVYASLPFLVTALAMGIRLMLGHYLLHGSVLLLCVFISAPTLALQRLQPRPASPPNPAVVTAMDVRNVVPTKASERPGQSAAPIRVAADVAPQERSLENLGFESGMPPWLFHGDSVEVTLTTSPVAEGLQSLKMEGRWEGWGWNNVYQSFRCEAGERITISGRVFVRRLDTTGLWLVAGIKLESSDGTDAEERTLDPRSSAGGWVDLEIRTTIRRTGEYVLRCLVCGGEGGSSTAVVYFDDLRVERAAGKQVATAAPSSAFTSATL